MRRQISLAVGGLMVIAGLVSLARSLGAHWADMEHLWPLVVMFGAALSLRKGLQQRRADNVWFGITAILSSALVACALIGGGGWRLLANWWPLTLLFAGLGWLSVWLWVARDIWSLLLALAAFSAGTALILVRLQVLANSVLSWLLTLWPWFLLATGCALVIVSIVRLRSHADRD